MFKRILPSEAEIALSLPGDERIKNATVINSAFDLPAPPEIVYPWFLQLGKKRAGWYFPRSVEYGIPKSKRGLRYIESRWQQLEVGQRIPDYGGKNGYLDCFYLEENEVIGYTSARGKMTMTWVITFRPAGDTTRVIIRLSIKTARPGRSMLKSIGKLFDRLTIAGLAAGLSERLRS
jgi:hypothetical protein